MNSRNLNKDEALLVNADLRARKRVNCGCPNSCPCCSNLREKRGNAVDGHSYQDRVSRMKMREGKLEVDH